LNMKWKCDGIIHRSGLAREDDHRWWCGAVVSNPRQKRDGIRPRGRLTGSRICARKGSRLPFDFKVGLAGVKSTDGDGLGIASTQNTPRCSSGSVLSLPDITDLKSEVYSSS
jgi:hypothetical protein